MLHKYAERLALAAMGAVIIVAFTQEEPGLAVLAGGAVIMQLIYTAAVWHKEKTLWGEVAELARDLAASAKAIDKEFPKGQEPLLLDGLKRIATSSGGDIDCEECNGMGVLAGDTGEEWDEYPCQACRGAGQICSEPVQIARDTITAYEERSKT